MSYLHVTSSGLQIFDSKNHYLDEDEIRDRIGCPIDRNSVVSYFYNQFTHQRKVICYDAEGFDKRYPFSARTRKGELICGEFIIAWLVIGYGLGKKPMLAKMSEQSIEISLREITLINHCINNG